MGAVHMYIVPLVMSMLYVHQAVRLVSPALTSEQKEAMNDVRKKCSIFVITPVKKKAGIIKLSYLIRSTS